MTGKAKAARISALAMGNLFYGGVQPQAGQIATAFAEASSVPTATPYTATAANAATFVADCGVIYAATGLPLQQTAAAPAVGQYTVAAGVYTFAAADSGKALLLNYTYTIAIGGLKIPVTNLLLGTTPTFGARFFTTFQNQAISLTLNNCTSSKLGFASKLEDFVMPEFDFSCFADSGGNVATWSFAEASVMAIPRESIEVLGHKVKPLTLAQVERIEAALFPADGKTLTNVQLAREVGAGCPIARPMPPLT